MTDDPVVPRMLGGALSRRAVIRSAATGAVLIGADALGACTPGGGGSDTAGNDGGGGEQKTDDNPFGVSKGEALEVVIFDGGYGTDYGTEHVKMYNEKWGPGAKMTATVKIAATLQPRLSSGKPPEVIDNSGPDAMPTAQLVAQNQLADLGPLLDAPSIDDPAVKIKDVLNPGVAEGGELDGVLRQLNYVYSMWGLWYSEPLFEEKGWTPATTMDEFMALCDKIKSDGSMSPFTHTGVHAQYMANVMCQQAVKHGGHDILLKIDNLEPDGWTNDSVVQVAKDWEKVAKEGYIHPSAVEQDHLTSQTAWLNKKAAMIPCGSWLENEMKAKVPDGFDMVVQPLPSLTSADELPYEAIGAGAGEPFVVAEEAANRAGAFEYLRIMLSNEATSIFADTAGSLCAVQGAADRLSGEPTTALQSVAEASKAAGENTFEVKFMRWYSDLKTAARDATRNLLSGKMTADQYTSTIQGAVDAVAKDSKIKKFKRT